jgi:hypothetical protein
MALTAGKHYPGSHAEMQQMNSMRYDFSHQRHKKRTNTTPASRMRPVRLIQLPNGWGHVRNCAATNTITSARNSCLFSILVQS